MVIVRHTRPVSFINLAAGTSFSATNTNISLSWGSVLTEKPIGSATNQLLMTMPTTIIDHVVAVDSNSKDGATVIGLDVAGVSVNTISVPAGVINQFSNLNLSIPLAAGSLFNIRRDATASTIGSFRAQVISAWLRVN